jgi:hypothetical protein
VGIVQNSESSFLYKLWVRFGLNIVAIIDASFITFSEKGPVSKTLCLVSGQEAHALPAITLAEGGSRRPRAVLHIVRQIVTQEQTRPCIW